MARFRRPRVRTIVRYVKTRMRRRSPRRRRGFSGQIKPMYLLIILGIAGFIFKDKITETLQKLKS